MLAYAAIPLTCWLCALVAAPRTPRIGDAVEARVYARLLGRSQLLWYLAIAATAVALLVAVLSLPSHALPAFTDTQTDHALCLREATGDLMCYSLGPDGLLNDN